MNEFFVVTKTNKNNLVGKPVGDIITSVFLKITLKVFT